MISFHKRDCFQRAKKLVENGDQESLRYACLELRQCIESVCYSKLLTYKKVVPEEEFKQWHPKQVYDFLLEMEPKADKSYSLKIYREDETGAIDKLVMQGNHETLSLKEINAIYNKLGYYLHTPTIAKQKTYIEDVKKLPLSLNKFIERLEPIVNTNFDMRFGHTISFSCESCSTNIYHNADTLKPGKPIRCLNINCGMMYIYQGDEIGFKPHQFIIDCECGDSIFINYFKLKDPSHISCKKCKARYNIEKRWVYQKEE